MPPIPIAGYRALYTRDKTTGEIYQIGSTSSVVNIDDLGDVTTYATGTTGPTGPSDGQVLLWDATLQQWVPGYQANALDDLSDVTIYATGATGPTGPADKDALVWDAAAGQWIPGARSIDDLWDVDTSTTGPTGGDGLVWDETVSLWVPGSPISDLDGLTDVDVSTDPPEDGEGLIWDEVLQLWVPGPVGVGFWDNFVAYEIEDMVLWPETAPTSLWVAWRDTTGEEPVAAGPMQPSGLLFPGMAGAGNDGPKAIPLAAGFDNTTGFDIRIQTNGNLGSAGNLFALWTSSGLNPHKLSITGTTLSFVSSGTTAYTATRSALDFTSRNFIRIVATDTTIDFYGSIDGSTWDPAGTQDVVTGLMGGVGNRVHIGHLGDGVPASNYDGIIRSVEIYDVTGATPMLSWDRTTQPGDLGAGISPVTGEEWVVIGDVLDDPPPDAFTPWTQIVGGAIKIDDLSDVDTSTTGPVDKDALVWSATAAQWVPGQRSIDDLWDVSTSATGPTGPTGPADGQVLLWNATVSQWIPGYQANLIDDLLDVDTSTTGPVDKDALVWDATGGQWVPGQRSIDDLWDVSTSGGATGASGPTGGQVLLWDETVSLWVPGYQANTIDDLTDVDTSTTGPVDKDALVWSASGNQWVPGARSIDDLWDVSTSSTGPTGASGPTGGQVLLWDETQSLWVPGYQANTIDDLTDVDTSTTGPVDKDALVWSASGGQWVPGARSIDDLWDVSTTGATGATGPSGPAHGDGLVWDDTLLLWVPGTPISDLDGLTDVDTSTTGPTGGQALVWDDTLQLWVPGTLSLDNLSDVDTAMMAPVDGNSLIWDDAQQSWVPGIPSGADEVVVGPDDPYALDPTATVEMWYDTATPPPPGLSAAIDWWDPVVNYVESDRVLWPEGDPSVWSALEDTTGWEPGVAQPAPAYYTFPGGAAGPFGLIASTGTQKWVNGVELRVTTNGTLGTTGTLATLGDADDVTLSMSGVGELTAFVKAGAGADLILTGSPYDPTIDIYIRVRVDFATLTASLETSDGLDGGWITLDSITYLAGTDPTVANAIAVHIGHDSTDTNNYDGTLGNVQTFDPSDDALLTSWEPFWQGTNGTGASLATGENYTLLAGTVLTPVDVVDRPSPWYFLADYNGPYVPLTGGTITGDLYVEGTLSANDVVDRTSSIATKSDVADLDLGAAGRLIDAIHPITFRRTDSSMRRVGFTVEDIESSGETDLVERLISSDGDPDSRGWSVAGLVAVLTAEVKRLRAEVEDLKNGA